jgi:UDP-4-amino-4,6-dideoxy-N-acetyl-beta-L-altrosamine transaminase
VSVIPYGRQEVTQADIDAVVAVLKSNHLTQGPMVPEFEAAVCAASTAKYAVAVNSATSALHIACLALGLGDGDWLWTSPNTFVASANCARYCGANVDFVDIDPVTYNLSADKLAEKLVIAKAQNRLPKIVVPVHFAGQSCDMQRIHELSQEYGFHIIEDAAHGIGGRYQRDPIGCGKYSDITTFSFHPVKIVTSAEGGMAVTNDPALADRMRRFRTHGITGDATQMPLAQDGPWHYQQIDLGYNYRMTELQAALGASQMARLDDYVARRQQLAERYDELLGGLPLTIPWRHTDTYSAFHLYVIRLHLTDLSVSRRDIYETLRARGVLVNIHYIPVHTQPYYQGLGFRLGQFPNAETYYGEAISIPLFPTLTESQQDEVVVALRRAMKQ